MTNDRIGCGRATLLTPAVIGKKYLPLNPVGMVEPLLCTNLTVPLSRQLNKTVHMPALLQFVYVPIPYALLGRFARV
jgi:hypothetical protein